MFVEFLLAVVTLLLVGLEILQERKVSDAKLAFIGEQKLERFSQLVAAVTSLFIHQH